MDRHAQAMWDLLDTTMRHHAWRLHDNEIQDRAYSEAARAMTTDHALYDAVVAKVIDPQLDHDRFMLLAGRPNLDLQARLQAADVMLDLMDKVMHQSSWNVRARMQRYFYQDVPTAFMVLAATIPEAAERAGAYRVAAFCSWAADDPVLVFKAHLDRLWEVTPGDQMRRSLSRAFANNILPAFARPDDPDMAARARHAREDLGDDVALQREPGMGVRR